MRRKCSRARVVDQRSIEEQELTTLPQAPYMAGIFHAGNTDDDVEARRDSPDSSRRYLIAYVWKIRNLVMRLML